MNPLKKLLEASVSKLIFVITIVALGSSIIGTLYFYNDSLKVKEQKELDLQRKLEYKKDTLKMLLNNKINNISILNDTIFNIKISNQSKKEIDLLINNINKIQLEKKYSEREKYVLYNQIQELQERLSLQKNYENIINELREIIDSIQNENIKLKDEINNIEPFRLNSVIIKPVDKNGEETYIGKKTVQLEISFAVEFQKEESMPVYINIVCFFLDNESVDKDDNTYPKINKYQLAYLFSERVTPIETNQIVLINSSIERYNPGKYYFKFFSGISQKTIYETYITIK